MKRSSIYIFILFFGFQLHAQELIIKSDFQQEAAILKKQYVQADSLINVCFGMLNKMDIAKVDMILVYSFHISDIEKMLKKINDFELPFKLDMAASDPLFVKSRLSQLFIETARNRTIIDQMKQNLDYHLYRKAMQYKADGNYWQALDLFERSIKANKYYYASHIELADLNYKYQKYDEAAAIIRNVYDKLSPEGEMLRLLIRSADTIYFSYIRRGNVFIQNQQFNEALVVLEKGRKFAEIDWIRSKDTVVACVRKAHQGLFDSYVLIIQKAIQYKKFNQAEPLILQVDGYVFENRQYLENTQKVDELVQQLIDQYIRQGELYLKQRKKTKADEMFKKASALCNRFQSCNRQSDIAAFLLVLNPPTTVVVSSPVSVLPPQQAVESKKENIITIVVNADSAWQVQLIQKLQDARLKAWANELEYAEQVFIETKQIVSNNPQLQSEIMFRELTSLEQRINERKCLNAKYESDNLLLKGMLSVRDQSYYVAIEFFVKALQALAGTSGCEQDSIKIIDKIEMYNKPGYYQRLLSEADALLQTGNVEVFCKIYSQAEKFYYQWPIVDYGLTHRSVASVLISNRKQDVLIKSIEQLILYDKLNEAMRVMVYIRETNILPEQVEHEQMILGAALAERDHKRNEHADPHENINSYTNQDKWYKFLKGAYIKRFKEL